MYRKGGRVTGSIVKRVSDRKTSEERTFSVSLRGLLQRIDNLRERI